jgi:hypothetical protein
MFYLFCKGLLVAGGDFTRLDHHFSRPSNHEKLVEDLDLLYQSKYLIT